MVIEVYPNPYDSLNAEQGVRFYSYQSTNEYISDPDYQYPTPYMSNSYIYYPYWKYATNIFIPKSSTDPNPIHIIFG